MKQKKNGAMEIFFDGSGFGLSMHDFISDASGKENWCQKKNEEISRNREFFGKVDI